ncbi:hypothetical protein PHET_01480 [Paragonimus heterotremus]|uniref:LIM zinc-binding domain-containing protein n=1 Tax=Paragonimus heterotremus TaxID=100268 RepID=A0A8J4TRQ1_9TREM|nr:hypothetical protein PHET_01480 [Paragonimus heterotremus]
MALSNCSFDCSVQPATITRSCVTTSNSTPLAPWHGCRPAYVPSCTISVPQPCCSACGYAVYAAEMLRVMGRVYHKRCFRCQKCCGVLGVENYHVLDGVPYCKAHYLQLLHCREVTGYFLARHFALLI